jgi:hypothetical protein
MTCNEIQTDRYANIALHGGPSPIGAWLRASFLRLVSTAAKTPVPHDRVREAAELRTWAARVQRTDPRFAADLFAAADRHETT